MNRRQVKATPALITRAAGVNARKPIAGKGIAVAVPGELIKSVYVGRLRDAADWARELSRLYRQMRKGEIPPDIATKMAYVGRVAAELSKVREEMEKIDALRAQLARIEADNRRALPYVPADDFDDSQAASDGLAVPEGQGTDA
jgi:hypothetical protein